MTRHRHMVQALLLIAPQVDPRVELIERYAKLDTQVFYEDDSRFGASRLGPPRTVRVGSHSVVTFQQKEYTVERFLVGNKTDKFTGLSMRTQFVPLTKNEPSSGEPKPTFIVKELEKTVRRFFGEDFKWTKNSSEWVVHGYPLRAKAPCLSCHSQSKEGDPLGYLVYAAGKKRVTSR